MFDRSCGQCLCLSCNKGLCVGCPPSTLKLYVAAISHPPRPHRWEVTGEHDLVVRFLMGARRLNPPRPPSLSSWDLALVLRALKTAHFEPLQSVELKFLSMKALLLTALASLMMMGTCRHFWLMNRSLRLNE